MIVTFSGGKSMSYVSSHSTPAPPKPADGKPVQITPFDGLGARMVPWEVWAGGFQWFPEDSGETLTSYESNRLADPRIDRLYNEYERLIAASSISPEADARLVDYRAKYADDIYDGSTLLTLRGVSTLPALLGSVAAVGVGAAMLRFGKSPLVAAGVFGGLAAGTVLVERLITGAHNRGLVDAHSDALAAVKADPQIKSILDVEQQIARAERTGLTDREDWSAADRTHQLDRVVERTMERFDTNENGAISAPRLAKITNVRELAGSEVHELGAMTHPSTRAEEITGPLPIIELRGFDGNSDFDVFTLDTNRDGSVTKAEMRASFDKLDNDKLSEGVGIPSKNFEGIEHYNAVMSRYFAGAPSVD